MTDCFTPTSVKASSILREAITIAIIPNWSGAKIRARIRIRKNRNVRPPTVPIPKAIAPFAHFALRLLPPHNSVIFRIKFLINVNEMINRWQTLSLSNFIHAVFYFSLVLPVEDFGIIDIARSFRCAGKACFIVQAYCGVVESFNIKLNHFTV